MEEHRLRVLKNRVLWKNVWSWEKGGNKRLERTS
jgi:hypothetical protein